MPPKELIERFAIEAPGFFEYLAKYMRDRELEALLLATVNADIVVDLKED